MDLVTHHQMMYILESWEVCLSSLDGTLTLDVEGR